MPWGRAGLSVSCSVKDPHVSAAIKYCLSAKEVDPKIKSKIISAFVSHHQKSLEARKIRYGTLNFYQYTQQISVFPKIEALSTIFDEMRKEGLRINLDRTELNFLNLSGLNLNGMTAVEAEFVCSNLSFAQMAFSDLSKANMIETNLSNADLTGSMMREVILQKATLSNSKLRYVDVTDAMFDETCLSMKDTDCTELAGVITADASLKKILNKFKKYFSSEITVSGPVRLSSA